MALYSLGMRVDDAYKLFRQLSARVFRGRSRVGVGVAGSAHALVVSCRNGKFPASDIDGALHDAFGDITMLDHPYMSSIGARIGFPVVDADTLETCVVTSYNGAGGLQEGDRGGGDDRAYRILRSRSASEPILVTDA